MEATIDELVDNLIKEKELDGKEADEITEALEFASKYIEPSNLSGFVKSIREKIDAPTSEIFTQNGLNLNELKNVAEVVANVVIKEQLKDSEKNKKNHESEYIQDSADSTNQDNEGKDDNQLLEEEMIREYEDFLDKFRPGLETTTKKRIARDIYDAQEYVTMCIGHINNGDSPENARKKTSECFGKSNSASADAIRDRNILLLLEKSQNDFENQNIQENSNNSNSQPIPSPFDIVKCLSEGIRNRLKWNAEGKVTKESLEEVQHANNIDLIKKLKEDIARVEGEIQKNSSKNVHLVGLIDKFKEIEKFRKQLRDTLRLDETYREKNGEKSVVENERVKKKQFLDIAKKRYFAKDNKETIVEIFEDMKNNANSKGINFEEIIGFDDILESVLEEMEKYSEQSANISTIRMRETKNYEDYREVEVLEIIKENAEKNRKEQLIAGDKSKAQYFDDLVAQYSKRKNKLLGGIISNIEENISIKKRVTSAKESIEAEDEIIRNAATVDTKQMRDEKNVSKFIAYATKLYFTSKRNVSEIYEEFKENCTSMGISVEDLIDAVSKETQKVDISTNYLTIKMFETQMRKMSLEIAALEEENRNASQNGEKNQVARNNKKIAKLKSEIESKKDTNSYIKKTVVLSKSREEKKNQKENAIQGKTPDVATDLKQEEPPEPKKKKGFFAFIKSAASKLGITSKEINEEVYVLSDLQKQELQETQTQPKAIKDKKVNNQLEVSTITVGGEEPVNELENSDIGQDER